MFVSASRRHKLERVGRVSLFVYLVETVDDQVLHRGWLHIRHNADGKFADNSAWNHRLTASAVESTLNSWNTATWCRTWCKNVTS